MSAVGVLDTALLRATPGTWDRGPTFRVRMSTGALSSVSTEDVLNGANAAAIGLGSDGPWEVIQFAEATLVGPDLWDIGLRLRGQAGTDGIMPDDWPPGALFVLLDGRPGQIELPLSARGCNAITASVRRAKAMTTPSTPTRFWPSTVQVCAPMRPPICVRLRSGGQADQLDTSDPDRRRQLAGHGSAAGRG